MTHFIIPAAYYLSAGLLVGCVLRQARQEHSEVKRPGSNLEVWAHVASGTVIATAYVVASSLPG